jgi:signal peptidase I
VSTVGRHQAPGIAVTESAVAAGRLVTRAVAAVLLAGTAVLMVGSAVAVFFLHAGISPVLTGSMSPTFDPGAAVLTRPVPVEKVRVGDVLVFRPPGHAESYAHRILTVSGDPKRPVITTKGDANPAPDAWKAQLTDPVVHEVVFAVPHLGRAIVAFHHPNVRPFALALAGLVFTAMGIRAALGSSHSKSPSQSPSFRTPSYAG